MTESQMWFNIHVHVSTDTKMSVMPWEKVAVVIAVQCATIWDSQQHRVQCSGALGK